MATTYTTTAGTSTTSSSITGSTGSSHPAGCRTNVVGMVAPEAAPIRCFLNDIPTIIAQHQQKQQHESSKLMDISTTQNMESSMRCSNAEDSNSNYHQRKRRKILDATRSTLRLRLLGTVVNVSSIPTKGGIEEEEEKSKMGEENMDVMNHTCHANTAIPPSRLQLLPAHQQGENDANRYNRTGSSMGRMALDDGTGTIISVQVTPAMSQQIRLAPGMILDVIVRVLDDPYCTASTAHDSTTSSNTDTIRFVADQLVVQDSMKETLRWFELSYQASLKNRRSEDPNSCTGSHNDATDQNLDPGHDVTMYEDHEENVHHDAAIALSPPLSPTAKPMPYHTAQSSNWMGYPTRDLTSEDIYRIIASECEFADYNHKNHDANNNNNNKYRTASNSNTTSTTHYESTSANNNNNGGRSGVALQDLADCFNYYSTAYIGTLVQELQSSGQIYQNENGLYTLL